MPADAGFDLAIGNEYYAGGWAAPTLFARQSGRRIENEDDADLEEGQLSIVAGDSGA